MIQNILPNWLLYGRNFRFFVLVYIVTSMSGNCGLGIVSLCELVSSFGVNSQSIGYFGDLLQFQYHNILLNHDGFWKTSKWKDKFQMLWGGSR